VNGCFWRSYTSGINTVLRRPAPDVFFTRMPLTFMFTGTRAAIFSATWWSKHGSTSALSRAPRPQPVVCGDPRLIREVGGPDLARRLNIPVSIPGRLRWARRGGGKMGTAFRPGTP